jgi:hypothetical protein
MTFSVGYVAPGDKLSAVRQLDVEAALRVCVRTRYFEFRAVRKGTDFSVPKQGRAGTGPLGPDGVSA